MTKIHLTDIMKPTKQGGFRNEAEFFEVDSICFCSCITLGIGIALAAAVAVLHVLFQINIFFIIIPMLLLLVLMNFVVPKMFSALAFDCGGIASGTMSVAFLFPICIGLCQALGLDALSNGFGIIGIIATVPILSIQVLGVIYLIKQKKLLRRQNEQN